MENGGCILDVQNAGRPTRWACNISDWCTETDTFDCLQSDRLFHTLRIPHGAGGNRAKTGKKDPQERCFYMELGQDIISPYPYIVTSDQSLTPYHRYTPKTPYDYLTTPRQPHNNFITVMCKEDDHKLKEARKKANLELKEHLDQ